MIVDFHHAIIVAIEKPASSEGSLTYGTEIHVGAAAYGQPALQGLIDISVDVIESKKTSTDDDFITNLVRANVEGDALSYDELLNMVSLLIIGLILPYDKDVLTKLDAVGKLKAPDAIFWGVIIVGLLGLTWAVWQSKRETAADLTGE